jgi:hypothetical protein
VGTSPPPVRPRGFLARRRTADTKAKKRIPAIIEQVGKFFWIGMNRGKCVCDCHFHDLMAVLREPFSDKSPHIITFTKKGFQSELCPHFLF